MRKTDSDPPQWHFVPVPPGTEARFRRWNMIMIAILAFIVLGLLAVASIPHKHSPVQGSQPTHPANLRIHERPSRRDTLSSQLSRLSSVDQFSSLAFRGALAVSCFSTGVDREIATAVSVGAIGELSPIARTQFLQVPS